MMALHHFTSLPRLAPFQYIFMYVARKIQLPFVTFKISSYNGSAQLRFNHTKRKAPWDRYYQITPCQ